MWESGVPADRGAQTHVVTVDGSAYRIYAVEDEETGECWLPDGEPLSLGEWRVREARAFIGSAQPASGRRPVLLHFKHRGGDSPLDRGVILVQQVPDTGAEEAPQEPIRCIGESSTIGELDHRGRPQGLYTTALRLHVAEGTDAVAALGIRTDAEPVEPGAEPNAVFFPPIALRPNGAAAPAAPLPDGPSTRHVTTIHRTEVP